MKISQELIDLSVYWVETGKWEALHDALIEANLPGHAAHLKAGLCAYPRHECAVSKLVNGFVLEYMEEMFRKVCGGLK